MFRHRPKLRGRTAPGRRGGFRPIVDLCETRVLLSDIPVTVTADTFNPGSLRFALAQANPGDRIVFQIPADSQTQAYNSVTQSWKITLQSPLAAVSTAGITIDGLTQQTQPGAATAYPVIELAPGLENIGDGLDLAAGGITVRGLVINSFKGNGLAIFGSGADGNLVTGNFIGTDVTGTLPRGNTGNGIAISSSNNTIGGSTAAARNVISANQLDGILVSPTRLNNATGNVVQGNLIGTDSTGLKSLGNGLAGVRVQSAGNLLGGPGAGNVVGGNQKEGVFVAGTGNRVTANFVGTNAGGAVGLGNGLSGITLQDSASNSVTGNVLSANGQAPIRGLGITLSGSGSHDNLVQGNLIGTDPTGSHALPNTAGGVLLISGATRNTVGGTAAGAGNVISGNTSDGITVYQSPLNAIVNNVIGTNSKGDMPLGNTNRGINLDNSSDTTIQGNLLSGNGTQGGIGEGILITGSGAVRNLVLGNLIGTDARGASAIGNLRDGMFIRQGASGNTVGGTSAGAGNVISGSAKVGIEISGSGTLGNVIAGNLIGLDVSGSKPLGNQFDGVSISGASQTVIGPFNVISGNGTNGEQAAGVNIVGPGAQGNTVFQNLIGTDATGARAIGNSLHGVFLGDGAQGNTVGPNNIISGNGSAGTQGVGVYVFGPTSSGNQVVGNLIGTDKSGLVSLDNSVIGVLVNQASGTNIKGNLVSGNRFVGVELAGATASGNQVIGNLIGLNVTGLGGIPNGIDGVFINDAPGNTVGGTTAGSGNVISANGSVGIQLFGPNTKGNVILGNALGLDINGQRTLPNPAGGIFVNTGFQANQIGGNGPGQANQGQTQPVYSLASLQQTGQNAGTLKASHTAVRFHSRGKARLTSARATVHRPRTGGVSGTLRPGPPPKGTLSIMANSPEKGVGPVTGRT